MCFRFSPDKTMANPSKQAKRPAGSRTFSWHFLERPVHLGGPSAEATCCFSILMTSLRAPRLFSPASARPKHARQKHAGAKPTGVGHNHEKNEQHAIVQQTSIGVVTAIAFSTAGAPSEAPKNALVTRTATKSATMVNAKRISLDKACVNEWGYTA